MNFFFINNNRPSKKIDKLTRIARRNFKSRIFLLIIILFIPPIIFLYSWLFHKYIEPFWKLLERDRLPPYDVFVVSSYYYPKSKSLGDNSIAMVLTAGYDYADTNKKITIVSWNETDSLVSTVKLERITPHSVCLWISILVTAPVLPSLTHLSVIQGDKIKSIPFQKPSNTKHKVVTCIAPLFANEQWQFFLFAVHTYRRYGSFMHLYARSMVKSMYDLAKEYEDKGYLKLQPWLRIHLEQKDPSHHLFNPNANVEFRNQAAAQTDCLLQYKEATDFIAFMDLDDVLIPRIGGTYFEEFHKLFYQFPNIGYIFYDKQNVNVRIQRSSKNFTLSQMFSSISFTGVSETGKMVTRPEYINSTWIHWPPSVIDDRIKYEVPQSVNVITHLKHIHYESKPFDGTIHTPVYNITGRNHKETLLSRKGIIDMQESLDKMSSLKKIKNIWNSLPTKWFHFDIILECYNRIFYRYHYSGHHEKMKCPGPDRCQFPRLNITCVNAQADFFSSAGSGDLVNFHYWRNARFEIGNECIR